jgi:luciferase family oxidoreductase group 1
MDGSCVSAVASKRHLSISLSVLDQSPIPAGSTPGDALRNTIDLAKLADRLGYRRYWMAEHHGAASLACASPEVMVGPIAAATTSIRVGTGGVMLPHYSPLKVAETFGMLASLYPGRIDLGIGRAAGTSPRVSHALQRDRRLAPEDDFPRQLDELRAYFGNARPDIPFRFEAPAVWLLGSSEQSAIWAAELGLPYVFADFINPQGAPHAEFYNRRCAEPRMGVAVSVFCAETDEEAIRLSASTRVALLHLFRGRSIPIPPVDEALAYLADEGAPASPLAGVPPGRRIVTGNPTSVRRSLEEIASEYGAEEVFVLTVMHDHAARRRSYELIAREFGIDVTREPASAERRLPLQ